MMSNRCYQLSASFHVAYLHLLTTVLKNEMSSNKCYAVLSADANAVLADVLL